MRAMRIAATASIWFGMILGCAPGVTDTGQVDGSPPAVPRGSVVAFNAGLEWGAVECLPKGCGDASSCTDCDGICTGSESCVTCAQDCGACECAPTVEAEIRNGWAQVSEHPSAANEVQVDLKARAQVGTNRLDTLVGLSAGTATRFSDLAAIVRFNSAGRFDARDGARYAADHGRNYERGQWYHIRMIVRVAERSYDVFVGECDQELRPLIFDAALRSDGPTGALNAVSAWTDGAGALAVGDITWTIPGVAEASNCEDCDGVCTGTESCSTCSEDCGVCDCSPPVEQSLNTGWSSFAQNGSADRDLQFDTRARVTGVSGAVDALVGVGSGPAQSFRDLGVIVRFNGQGFFDARDGASYRADTQIRYEPGAWYQLRTVVRVHEKSYDVFIAPCDGAFVPLITAAAFRSDALNVGSLDHIGAWSSGTSTVQLSGMNWQLPSVCGGTGTCEACDGQCTGAENCATCPGDCGVCECSPEPVLSNQNVWETLSPGQPQSNRLEIAFKARVNGDGPFDSVLGITSGEATGFSDVAANVRFNPDGFFDARDGNLYAADASIAYNLGQWYEFKLFIRADSRRYDVWVGQCDGELAPLITDAEFRTNTNAPLGWDGLATWSNGTTTLEVADLNWVAGECVPQSCDTLGLSCGATQDGCGTSLNCGSCEAGELCSSSGQCIRSGDLAFAPPSGWENFRRQNVPASGGRINLDSNTDYRLVFNQKVTGTVDIHGGRNVVLIGGHISIERQNRSDWKKNYGIRLRDQSGEVFIEGMLINGPYLMDCISGGSDRNLGNRTWTIQNTHCGEMLGSKNENGRNKNDRHADFVQPWDGVDYVRLDRNTFGGTSTSEGSHYQGLLMKADFNIGPRGGPSWDIRRTNMYAHNGPTGDKDDLYGGGLYLVWAAGSINSIAAEDFWVAPNPQWKGGLVGKTVYPERNDRRTDALGTYSTLPLGNGRVYEGRPPNGDFCPPSVPGLGYASPGYRR